MTYYSNPIDVSLCQETNDVVLIDTPSNQLMDVSYAVSYYPEIKAWVSYHSYIPKAIFALRNKTISTNGNTLYLHNKGNYGLYYNGNYYASYITFVFKSPFRDRHRYYPAWFCSIGWNSSVITNGIENNTKTITSVSVHNSNQATKEIFIIPFNTLDNVSNQYDVANARLSKNLWFFNKFRNERQSGTRSEWLKKEDLIKNKFSLADILGTIVYDAVSLLETLRRFVGEYLLIRVTLENKAEDNSQYLLHEIDVETKIVKR